jgi:hypothetical protein
VHRVRIPSALARKVSIGHQSSQTNEKFILIFHKSVGNIINPIDQLIGLWEINCLPFEKKTTNNKTAYCLG